MTPEQLDQLIAALKEAKEKGVPITALLEAFEIAHVEIKKWIDRYVDLAKKMYPEGFLRVHSAAVRLEDGRIFAGLRHRHAYDAGHAVVDDRLYVNKAEEGFLTEGGQFLNRMEAMELVLRTGQVKEEDLCDKKHGLFSEDLY